MKHREKTVTLHKCLLNNSEDVENKGLSLGGLFGPPFSFV